MKVVKLFVDTNIFLRYFLEDNSVQLKKAKQIFDRGAMGEVEIHSSLVVYLEIYWVLKDFYGYSRNNLRVAMLKVMRLKIKFKGRPLFVLAVRNMADFNYDLEDAFNFYSAKELEVSEFVTFDTRLEKAWKKAV